MKKVFLTILAVMLFACQAYAGPVTYTLLSAVTATGASSGINTSEMAIKTVYVVASSVTTGGTLTVDASPDNTNWVTVNTQAITANGVTEIAIVGLLQKYLRVNLSARTDGTYTVYLVGQK